RARGDGDQRRSQEPLDQSFPEGQGKCRDGRCIAAHAGRERCRHGHHQPRRVAAGEARQQRRRPVRLSRTTLGGMDMDGPAKAGEGTASAAPTMTKSELIARLAERYPQLVAKDAEFAVRTILDAMARTLSDGHRIEIRGFGSFALSYRPPRVGRNPKSGEKVMVPEKWVPHFKPGKDLRERVDAGMKSR